jgi:hypothetical protein
MRHTLCPYIGGLVVLVAGLLVPVSIVHAAGVDPADVIPLAELVGGILAVPIARLFAALCVTFAVLAVAHGHGGLCLFLVVLAGLVLVAPAIVKAMVWQVAVTVQG